MRAQKYWAPLNEAPKPRLPLATVSPGLLHPLWLITHSTVSLWLATAIVRIKIIILPHVQRGHDSNLERFSFSSAADNLPQCDQAFTTRCFSTWSSSGNKNNHCSVTWWWRSAETLRNNTARSDVQHYRNGCVHPNSLFPYFSKKICWQKHWNNNALVCWTVNRISLKLK